MKKVLISESDLVSLIKILISEETKIVTDYDQYWDYKKDGDVFYAKKKSSQDWIKLKGKPLRAVKSKVFKIKTDNTNKDKTNQDKINKDKTNKDNSEKLKKLVKVSPNANPAYLKQINLNNLSSTKMVNNVVPKPGTTDCAQFVNNYNTKLGYIGDAWLAQDVNSVGKRIFSIYDNIDKNTINKYVKLYREDDDLNASDVRSFQQELLSKKPTPPPLQLDDVVGIYNPKSPHTVEAFLKGGEKYFIRGGITDFFRKVPGKTLLGGKGFSFNTHVGIVGAIVDGVPVIFHNMFGDVRSEPAKNLKITWVKRQ